jgi:peptide-methionine (R)-S-oxide reductase
MRRSTALWLGLGVCGIAALTPNFLSGANAQDAPLTTEEVSETPVNPSTLSDADWRALLSGSEYRVLRKKGTERAFSGEFWDSHDNGIYVCGGCGENLFSSEHKFESGTGWPSFYQAIQDGKVESVVDSSFGMRRVEVVCANCGGHLGHVFPDGPQPTGDRFCVNSASLDFVPRAVPPSGE